MKNLRLLQKLQASEMVTLILKTAPGDMLEYFIVSKTINYCIVSNGSCEGNIDADTRCFTILLSGLMPMVEKGYDFRIHYEDDVLTFVSSDERLTLRPLCVETKDEQADTIILKYLRYIDAVQSDAESQGREEVVAREIADLQRNYDGMQRLHLEGTMQSSDPFTEDSGAEKIDQAFVSRIADKKEELRVLQEKSKLLSVVEMKPFASIIYAAARAHEVINFCGDYAIMELKTSYILQKSKCNTMAVPGTILQQLYQFGGGEGFYWFENSLMFVTGDKEKTVVFLEKFLPNTTVDSTIVTRGAVLEFYNLSVKGILKVTQLMKSKFPDMTFDMGNSMVFLENEKGESIKLKFDVNDTDTLDLRSAMKGRSVTVTMAKISIPKEVQSLLSLFRDELIVRVKERKIIFQGGTLFLVFGR